VADGEDCNSTTGIVIAATKYVDAGTLKDASHITAASKFGNLKTLQKCGN
jgi:hypothetical protein